MGSGSIAEKQADSVGCRLDIVYLTPECTNKEYQKKMEEVMIKYRELGFTRWHLGHFLEDIRNTGKKIWRRSEWRPFSLMGRDTGEIATLL